VRTKASQATAATRRLGSQGPSLQKGSNSQSAVGKAGASEQSRQTFEREAPVDEASGIEQAIHASCLEAAEETEAAPGSGSTSSSPLEGDIGEAMALNQQDLAFPQSDYYEVSEAEFESLMQGGHFQNAEHQNQSGMPHESASLDAGGSAPFLCEVSDAEFQVLLGAGMLAQPSEDPDAFYRPPDSHYASSASLPQGFGGYMYAPGAFGTQERQHSHGYAVGHQAGHYQEHLGHTNAISNQGTHADMHRHFAAASSTASAPSLGAVQSHGEMSPHCAGMPFSSVRAAAQWDTASEDFEVPPGAGPWSQTASAATLPEAFDGQQPEGVRRASRALKATYNVMVAAGRVQRAAAEGQSATQQQPADIVHRPKGHQRGADANGGLLFFPGRRLDRGSQLTPSWPWRIATSDPSLGPPQGHRCPSRAGQERQHGRRKGQQSW